MFPFLCNPYQFVNTNQNVPTAYMCTENVLVSNDWRTEREKRNCTADMRVERKKIDVLCPVSVAAVAIR